MQIKVHQTETPLFVIKIFATIAIMIGLVALLSTLFSHRDITTISTYSIFITYAVVIWGWLFFQKVYLVAHLKGSGIEITNRQFPEIHEVYTRMIMELSIKTPPKLFLVQHGGLLNAFAVRFSGKNYVAIYSDVFSLIESDLDAVRFVLAHELGHVKRNHMSKRFWTFPSSLIPFLTAAYSRACEYTCDNVGHALAPNGSLNGLLVLAAGKDLYKRIDIEDYIETQKRNTTFSVQFVNLFMSHPYLPKRLKNLKQLESST